MKRFIHRIGEGSRLSTLLLILIAALQISSCVKNTVDIETPEILDPVDNENFSTDGHVVYHVRTGDVGSAERSVITASFDGTILCNRPNGELLWESVDTHNFPFDLEVADVDGDGYDEVFVAKAGGVIEAYDHDGALMWAHTIASEGNLFQVRAGQATTGDWYVYTGGVSEELYIYKAKTGTLVKTIAMGDVVRLLSFAKVDSKVNESLIISTLYSGLGGGLRLSSLDQTSLEIVKQSEKYWDSDYKSRPFSMVPIDVDEDGYDELYVSGDSANIRLFEDDLTGSFSKTDVTYIPYRMTFLHDVELEGERRILGQYGGYLVIYDLDGEVVELIETTKDYANSFYDPETTTLYLASSSSGGDGVYSIDLSDPDWRTIFLENEYIGTMSDVEANLAELADQVDRFQRPIYQSTPKNLTIMGGSHTITDYYNIDFVRNYQRQEVLPEDYLDQLWSAETTDGGGSYTQAEILAEAATYESKGQDFVLWGCHGSEMYMSPETMYKVIETAPNHFIGFVLTEMEKRDDRMSAVIEQIVEPLADKCLETGKKIIFWNKNIFWAGSCYYDFWESFLFNPKYKSVIIPAMEETNSRTQEINLAGNIGLWASEHFDNWSCRIVSDNCSFDRMWEWASQQNPSYYYREISLNASYGADIFFTDVNQGELSVTLRDQLATLHELLSKGVVIIPEVEDQLSIMPLCLGMKIPPSDRYIESGTNAHGYTLPDNLDTDPMLFDRMDAYWGAAPMLDHDFSKYGYGCIRRYLNFLPRLPYGMVPILPYDYNYSSNPIIDEMVVIDGESFYEGSAAIDCVTYKSTMVEKLKAAQEKMLVKISGDVSWSAVRVDATHIRMLLIDPGYVSPMQRTVEVTLQKGDMVSATNILSIEEYPITDNTITVTVPAGIFSVVDIEYTE